MRPFALPPLAGLAAVCALAATVQEAPAGPDLVVVGRIFTADPKAPWAEALASSAGRIVYVGDRAGLPEAAAGALRIDVPEGVVLPGLVDAHAHLLGLGLARGSLDLAGTRDLDELVERVRARERELPAGRWLQGRGWDQNGWPDPRFPHRRSLDEAVPGRPVYLVRVDGHAAFVNAAALRASGIGRDTPDPSGGKILRDESGEPTGVLIDNAMALVRVPAPSLEERKAALYEAMRLAAEAGLTGVHDMGNDPVTLAAFGALAAEGRMPVRVYAMLAAGALATPDGGPLLAPQLPTQPAGRFTLRGVKLFADGALGSRGAALEQPYSDEPGNRGLLLMSPEALCEAVDRAGVLGLQAAVHAIGDRGNRVVLDCVERLGREGRPPVRPRIEHTQVLAPDDVERIARLGVIASMQPTHATSDMPWAEQRLGPERIQGAYAWRSLAQAGATLAFGSDFPVESHLPLWGLYAALTRQDHEGRPEGGWYPSQRLTLDEAVSAFTRGAAFAAFQEAELGSLEPGKLADLTVLDRDPWALGPRALLEAEVLWTLVGGEVVHRRR
jgi:predicted amidohydrolase YtcJ